MKIYNKERISEVREKLKLEILSYDDMCKFIFNSISKNYTFCKNNFSMINEGSARAAYSIKGTDVVVKVSYYMEDYDKEVCLQGAIEQRAFEKYKDHDLCYEIYGFSDNCGLVFCQELESQLTLENVLDYGLKDLYNYINNIFLENGDCECEMDEETFADYLEANISHFLERNKNVPFEDIYIDNIGIDKEYGELKILDLGYGDDDFLAEEVLEELLIDGKRIIRGASDFYSWSIRDIIERYGGYDNKIVA